MIHITQEHREFPDNGQFVGMAVFFAEYWQAFFPVLREAGGFDSPPPRLLLQEEVGKLNAADDRRRRRLRQMFSNHLGVEHGLMLGDKLCN